MDNQNCRSLFRLGMNFFDFELKNYDSNIVNARYFNSSFYLFNLDLNFLSLFISTKNSNFKITIQNFWILEQIQSLLSTLNSHLDCYSSEEVQMHLKDQEPLQSNKCHKWLSKKNSIHFYLHFSNIYDFALKDLNLHISDKDYGRK